MNSAKQVPAKRVIHESDWLKNEHSPKVSRLEIKPCDMKELSQLYGNASYKTLNRWLAPFKDLIGKRNGRFYTVKQVEIIYKSLGVPFTIEG